MHVYCYLNITEKFIIVTLSFVWIQWLETVVQILIQRSQSRAQSRITIRSNYRKNIQFAQNGIWRWMFRLLCRLHKPSIFQWWLTFICLVSSLAMMKPLRGKPHRGVLADILHYTFMGCFFLLPDNPAQYISVCRLWSKHFSIFPYITVSVVIVRTYDNASIKQLTDLCELVIYW